VLIRVKEGGGRVRKWKTKICEAEGPHGKEAESLGIDFLAKGRGNSPRKGGRKKVRKAKANQPQSQGGVSHLQTN